MTKHNRTTKKNSGPCQGYCCDKTTKGLQKWYNAKFEKLGWMVLAKKHGLHDRISVYRSSIDRLINSIEHKLEYHTRDPDRKDDLKIMLENVRILKEHVNNNLD